MQLSLKVISKKFSIPLSVIQKIVESNKIQHKIVANSRHRLITVIEEEDLKKFLKDNNIKDWINTETQIESYNSKSNSDIDAKRKLELISEAKYYGKTLSEYLDIIYKDSHKEPHPH